MVEPTGFGDDFELWAHVDHDAQTVWFGSNAEYAAIDSGLSPQEFVDKPWVRNAESIRLVGDHDNAELITRLWHLKQAEQPALKIHLAKPVRGAKTPGRAINLARRIHGAPSVGGWHLMVAAEYPGYALIRQLRKQGQRRSLADLAKTLLEAHPAYPALSFLPSVDLYWSAALLAMIVDPRWHVNPEKPDRNSGLNWFLGLGFPAAASADYVSRAMKGELEHDGAGYGKTLAATRAWAPWALSHRDEKSPTAFLGKAARKEGDNPRGYLTATKLFVRFLREVWLDRLTPQRKYERVAASREWPKGRLALAPARTYSPQLFVPEHFFEDPRVAILWRKHAARHDEARVERLAD